MLRTTPLPIDVAPSPPLGSDLAAAPSAIEVHVESAILRGVTAKWLAQNREALVSSNAYVEQRGLPLARYRSF